MKKKATKLVAIGLVTFITATSFVTQETDVEADSNIATSVSDLKDVKDYPGDSYVKKRTATASDRKQKITQTLQFNFIKDKDYDKEMIVLKTQGIIASGFRNALPQGYNEGILKWPGEYFVKVSPQGSDSTQVVDYAPKNNDASREVRATYGYKIGGDLSLRNGSGSGSLSADYNYSETVKYRQDSYRTYLGSPVSDKAIAWTVEANGFIVNGFGPYSRERFDDSGNRYGNEMFLGKRQCSCWGSYNFVNPASMPTLATQTFNPEFLTVLSHDTDDKQKTTQFKVEYGRKMDDYKVHWNNLHWWGENIKNTSTEGFVATYEVNWETHEVKFVNTQSERKPS